MCFWNIRACLFNTTRLEDSQFKSRLFQHQEVISLSIRMLVASSDVVDECGYKIKLLLKPQFFFSVIEMEQLYIDFFVITLPQVSFVRMQVFFRHQIYGSKEGIFVHFIIVSFCIRRYTIMFELIFRTTCGINPCIFRIFFRLSNSKIYNNYRYVIRQQCSERKTVYGVRRFNVIVRSALDLIKMRDMLLKKFVRSLIIFSEN